MQYSTAMVYIMNSVTKPTSWPTCWAKTTFEKMAFRVMTMNYYAWEGGSMPLEGHALISTL